MRLLLALSSTLLAGCQAEAPAQAPAGTSAQRSAAAATTGEFRERKLVATERGTDAEFGFSVDGAGDLDDDGHADLLVGAHQQQISGIQTGAAYIFLGNSDGATQAVRLLASDGASGDRFGVSVAGGGDLDDDGLLDVAVGAHSSDTAAVDGGAVYLFFGSPSGVTTPDEVLLTAPDAAASARFGIALTMGGDADGDGVAELAVGADQAGIGGQVYVYAGGGDLLDPTVLVGTTPAAGDAFGSSLDWAGDVDGDGFDDLVIGASGSDGERTGSSGTETVPDAGAAWVFFGGLGGIDAASGVRLRAATQGANDRFGISVAGAGDINGDGRDDIVIGAYQDDDVGSNAGTLHLFYGAAAGPSATSNAVYTAPDAAAEARLGTSVAGLGDVDGDGFGDIVVGASGASVDGISGGTAYVFFGASSGFDRTRTEQLTGSDLIGADRYGKAVAGPGDVDGDGFDDVFVGAYSHGSSPLEAGAAYLVLAPCTDQDADGACSSVDCDDTDPNTFPGAAPFDSETACMTDADDDGWGDDSPVAGVTPGTDCLDGNRDTFPGAAEAESSDACMADADEDGFGDVGGPAGVARGTDCDDLSDTTFPGAAELDSTTACMADLDADGFGDASAEAPVTAGGDCDDGDAATFPGAAADESATACMTDGDGDGWGSDSPRAGVTAGTDCDDDDADRSPGQTEVCNDVDDDCDGTVDGGGSADATTWYPDADGDGWTAEEGAVSACAPPEGMLEASYQWDCDDGHPGVKPGGVEIAGDGIDQDCDGLDAELRDSGCSVLPAAGGLWMLPWALLVLRRRR